MQTNNLNPNTGLAQRQEKESPKQEAFRTYQSPISVRANAEIAADEAKVQADMARRETIAASNRKAQAKWAK